MYLYVIGESDSGPCKIGFADRVEHRLITLQSGNPRRLTLYFRLESDNYRMAEKIAKHRAGKAGKLIRGEWFEVTAREAERIVKQACHTASIARRRKDARKDEKHRRLLMTYDFVNELSGMRLD